MSTTTEDRELMSKYLPRPIHSEAAYRRTLRQIESLMELKSSADSRATACCGPSGLGHNFACFPSPGRWLLFLLEDSLSRCPATFCFH